MSPIESPIEEQPGGNQSSSECSTPSPGFPHPSGGFPTPTPTSTATTPVIDGNQPSILQQTQTSTTKTQVQQKRPPGPVRRHSEVTLRSSSEPGLRAAAAGGLKSPSSMPDFDNPQPNQSKWLFWHKKPKHVEMFSNRTTIWNKQQGSYCFTMQNNIKLIAALLFIPYCCLVWGES